MLTSNATKITDWRQLSQWCLVAFVGALSGWAFSNLFSQLFLWLYDQSRSTTIKAIWVAVAGAGTGVTFALGVTVTARLLNLPDNEPLWWRIVGSAVIIGWFGIVLTLALDARARLRSEREHLVQEAIALESSRLNTAAIIDEMRQEVSHEVEQALRAARDDIDEHLGTQTVSDVSTWQDVAATLRTTALDTVRPLSRDLWDSARQDLQRPRPWSLLAYVIAHQPLRPLSVSVLYVLGGISTLLQAEWPASAALELVIGVAIIAAVMFIANILMRRWQRHHALIFITAALSLQSLVILKAVDSSTGAPAESVAGNVATVLAGLIVIVATSTFGAVRNMTQRQLDVIAAHVDHDFVEVTARSQALAEVMREASMVIHGSVQARLLGCAIAVEEAGRSRDAEQFNLALTRARTELQQPLPALGRPEASSILEELERRRDLWEGLCEVSYELSRDLAYVRPSTIVTCGRIVEEGISNATRHGGAQIVVIGIERLAPTDIHPRLLRITVTDDGHGVPEGPISSGLGLHMIATVANSWALTNVDGHGRLTVDLLVT